MLQHSKRIFTKPIAYAATLSIDEVRFPWVAPLIQQHTSLTTGQHAMVSQKSNQQDIPLSIRIRVQPIGEIAVQNGLLTTDQIVRICNEQKSSQMVFGELAKQLGFLTGEQLEFLIKAKQEHDQIVDEALMQCC
ncbi:MAG: hypothetical protein CMM01_16715 [Rhodopirellula sp.]|nr:hypothetical protein [Rhodopirellula sp.]OUX50224.1 MAG: hypothetical protein CBE43_07750 [Rhodopirellula sp. TMED283]